jgi:hypothetical protein
MHSGTNQTQKTRPQTDRPRSITVGENFSRSTPPELVKAKHGPQRPNEKQKREKAHWK